MICIPIVGLIKWILTSSVLFWYSQHLDKFLHMELSLAAYSVWVTDMDLYTDRLIFHNIFQIAWDWHFRTGLITEDITQELKWTNLFHKIIYNVKNNFCGIYLFSKNKWKERRQNGQAPLKTILCSGFMSTTIDMLLLALSFCLFLWTTVLLNHFWTFAKEQLWKVLCYLFNDFGSSSQPFLELYLPSELLTTN